MDPYATAVFLVNHGQFTTAMEIVQLTTCMVAEARACFKCDELTALEQKMRDAGLWDDPTT